MAGGACTADSDCCFLMSCNSDSKMCEINWFMVMVILAVAYYFFVHKK